METPSRHSFNLDGSLRVFPIPSAIKGDNYCRLEVDNVIVNDRAKYDIVNNSIVFLNIADVSAGSVLDVLVVQSEESLGQLAITTNIDIVADDIANVNIVGINAVETLSLRIYNASGVLLINKTETIIDGKVTLNLFSFSSGVYFFEILSGGNKEIHKVVKL